MRAEVGWRIHTTRSWRGEEWEAEGGKRRAGTIECGAEVGVRGVAELRLALVCEGGGRGGAGEEEEARGGGLEWGGPVEAEVGGGVHGGAGGHEGR